MLFFHPKTQFHAIKTTLDAMEETDLEHGNTMKALESSLKNASPIPQERELSRPASQNAKTETHGKNTRLPELKLFQVLTPLKSFF